MINKDTFCTLAYNGLAVNQDATLAPCCQYMPDVSQPIHFTDYSTYVATVRQEMHEDHIAGRKHSGCKKCWREEELGLKSLRWFANNQWYKNLSTPVVSEDNPLFEIELRFGNLCNLKCIMCTPKASSALHTERLVNAEIFERAGIPVVREKIPEWWETTEFQEFSTRLFDHARRVNITGGEPFMIAETINVLDRLLPRRNEVMISFNSNLTKLPKAILERLDKFPKLSIAISLEGVSKMAEYLRYPCRWQDVDANIRSVIDLLSTKRISVHHTLQHGSMYSLPALAEYCYDLGVKISYTTVYGVECLTLHSVPPADRETFLLWLEATHTLDDADKNFLRNAVNSVKFDLQQYRDFRKYVETLDLVRGTYWDKVFQPKPAYA